MFPSRQLHTNRWWGQKIRQRTQTLLDQSGSSRGVASHPFRGQPNIPHVIEWGLRTPTPQPPSQPWVQGHPGGNAPMQVWGDLLSREEGPHRAQFQAQSLVRGLEESMFRMAMRASLALANQREPAQRPGEPPSREQRNLGASVAESLQRREASKNQATPAPEEPRPKARPAARPQVRPSSSNASGAPSAPSGQGRDRGAHVSTCSICRSAHDEDVCMVVSPCMHKCMCVECAEAFEKQQPKKCPLCRLQCDLVFRIYG